MPEVLRRCDTLQNGAGGIIAACIGLLFTAVEWGKPQEKPLQSPVHCFAAFAVYIVHGRHKTRCKRLYRVVLQQSKIKAPHPQRMQGKRKAPPRGRGGLVRMS